MNMPVIYAHRGASFHAPENTMPAFRLAMEQGADGIELDVHLTRDGVPVVIHDETAARTGSRAGAIKDRTYEAWGDTDFGSWKDPRYTGTKLPSLAEVLDLLAPWHGRLNIELKTDVERYPGIEQAVLRLVDAVGMRRRVVISSFHHESLAVCRQLDGEIETAALLGRRQPADLVALRRMGVTAIHPDVRDATHRQVKRWHEAGFTVRPWTIDYRLLMLWQAWNGADAIITNKPRMCADFLRPLCRRPKDGEVRG